MIDLEYILLFGLPQNKLEILDGKTRVLLAFPDPQEAIAQFRYWLETLERWQDTPALPLSSEENDESRLIGGFELYRDQCVVHIRLPIDSVMMFNNSELQYDRESWGLGEGIAGGVHSFHAQRALSDKLDLRIFGTELLLTPDSMVAPIAYGFKDPMKLPLGTPEGQRGEVGHHYIQGVPDLLLEVLLPATESELRGGKMTLYREAGLPELWLLDTYRGVIEVYRRLLDRFALVGKFGPGQTFPSHGSVIDPAQLLPPTGKEQTLELWKKAGSRAGLEHFLSAGAPLRHFDFYHGLARRWFACSSAQRSQLLEEQTSQEIARWDSGGEVFQLRRVGDRLLRLDVRIDAAIHRRLFRYWHFEGKW